MQLVGLVEISGQHSGLRERVALVAFHSYLDHCFSESLSWKMVGWGTRSNIVLTTYILLTDLSGTGQMGLWKKIRHYIYRPSRLSQASNILGMTNMTALRFIYLSTRLLQELAWQSEPRGGSFFITDPSMLRMSFMNDFLNESFLLISVSTIPYLAVVC